MKERSGNKKKILRYFIITFLIIALPLCLLPINLFDGEIVFDTSVGNQILPRRLSLSYFLGIGYEAEDMIGIKEFRLTTQGKILAFLFLFGIPSLVAYRIYLSKK